jgi:endonuclease/exonuclease/phosphatase family metal-dependent hydrolase
MAALALTSTPATRILTTIVAILVAVALALASPLTATAKSTPKTSVPKPPASAPRLTVATFNVRTTETEVAGHTWDARKARVAEYIRASGASVVALQEAGSVLADVSDGTTRTQYWQYQEVRDILGWPWTLTDEAEFSRGEGREGTRILYDATRVTLLEHGSFAPSAVDRYIRYIPWARFLDNASGRVFLFVSVHLDDRIDKSSLRVAQMRTVIRRAKALRGNASQIVLAGDLNSATTSPGGNRALRAAVKAGAFDASRTKKPIDIRIDSFNDFLRPKRSGYTTDYILTLGGPKGSFSYRNWVVRKGVIPSDHYLQSATLPL